MDLLIHPGILTGTLSVISSKSLAHRLLICAAFSDNNTELYCWETNRDMEATADCLNALGAQIQRTDYGYHVTPVQSVPLSASLPCGDSGSTLRFLLPIVGALGVDAVFHLEGRLADRPLSPLWEEMERMGCKLSYLRNNLLHCEGKLSSGEYRIDGGISSQFISGLLFAAALIQGENRITVTGKIESKPYIEMTLRTMADFGCSCEQFIIKGGLPYHSPGKIHVEGDWSNAAFFLAANSLGSRVTLDNLTADSVQGDSIIASLLPHFAKKYNFSAADNPDLIPILAIVAAYNQGAEFTDIQRLRLKESDRVASIIAMIRALGGKAEATEDTLTIFGGGLTGGIVDCMNDHRIAMAATIGATVCKNDVVLHGSECVAKSYPNFFEEFHRLGGKYEQYLR